MNACIHYGSETSSVKNNTSKGSEKHKVSMRIPCYFMIIFTSYLVIIRFHKTKMLHDKNKIVQIDVQSI